MQFIKNRCGMYQMAFFIALPHCVKCYYGNTGNAAIALLN